MKKEAENKTLAQAMISVMKAVKGIDKSMTVGTGGNSYKGIADKDVKLIIGKAMADNGLSIVPIEIKPNIQVDRWETNETWNGKTTVKQKQSVFTDVTVNYLLMHESGESIKVAGYGHGVDAMDKGAGKAMTYSLKTLLLYMFLVPTGSIDDTDATHSNDSAPAPAKKMPLTESQFKKAIVAVEMGDVSTAELRKEFQLNTAQSEELKKVEAKIEKLS